MTILPETMNLNPVAQSAQFIYENSEYVSVNLENVEKFCQKLEADINNVPFNYLNWSFHELNPNPNFKNALEWIFLVDSLNFSFWSDLEINNDINYIKKYKYGVLYKGKIYQGYWSLPAVINRALDNGIDLLNFNTILSMTNEELKQLFYSDYSLIEPYPPLIEERIFVMKQISFVMISKYNNKVENLIQKGNKDAIQLMTIITQDFNCFKDQCEFLGKTVQFNKRAQIFIADVAAYLEYKNLGEFNNINQITMFPDYRVPQTLLKLEILKYNDKLMNKLIQNEAIDYGQLEEIEIRGNSIWAVELIIQQLNKKFNLNAIKIDFYLWEYAQHYKLHSSNYPIHRTRSIYY
ncbi:hypothetical protein K502DRAFT_368746 [Neoconidiobolus thromboides FSU 785]|nr:hypothetical protein K502DRAFT_368746 [Neoconidiobolus thromboides FSU 785]